MKGGFAQWPKPNIPTAATQDCSFVMLYRVTFPTRRVALKSCNYLNLATDIAASVLPTEAVLEAFQQLMKQGIDAFKVAPRSSDDAKLEAIGAPLDK